jgi:hypothetical protein
MGFFRDLMGSVSTDTAAQYTGLLRAREEGRASAADKRELKRLERDIPRGAKDEIERRWR